MPEGLAWFERLLAKADDEVPGTLRANAHALASFMEMLLGSGSASTEHGRTAVALAEAAGEGNEAVLILGLGALAAGARMTGDLRAAYSMSDRLISITRRAIRVRRFTWAWSYCRKGQ